jgi:hypothetical protein
LAIISGLLGIWFGFLWDFSLQRTIFSSRRCVAWLFLLWFSLCCAQLFVVALLHASHIVLLLRAKALRTTFARRTKVLLLGVLISVVHVLLVHSVHSVSYRAHTLYSLCSLYRVCTRIVSYYRTRIVSYYRTRIVVCPLAIAHHTRILFVALMYARMSLTNVSGVCAHYVCPS